MPVSNWLRHLFARPRTIRNAPKSTSPRPSRARLAVATLEERTVPALLTVTTWTDNPADGYTLREAVADANATAGADTIDFSFDFALHDTIVLTGGQLDVTDSLTIDGPGRDLLAISGNDASRIFAAVNSSSGTTLSLTIKEVTLTNGKATDASSFGANGGAVYFNSNYYYSGTSTLRFEDARVQDSRAESSYDARGGGVYFYGTALELVDSAIEGNVAAATDATNSYYTYAYGGGIFAEARDYQNSMTAITVTGSTITGNTASAVENGSNSSYYYNYAHAYAGGAWLTTDAGTGVSITDSVVSDNTATATADESGYYETYAEARAGGAFVEAYGSTGGVSILNSQFDGNAALAVSASSSNSYYGAYSYAYVGGLHVYSQRGQSISESTFRDNVADATATSTADTTSYYPARAYARAGGLYTIGYGTISLSDLLVEGNEATATATDAVGASNYGTSAEALAGGVFAESYDYYYYSTENGLFLTDSVIRDNNAHAHASGSSSSNNAYSYAGGLWAYTYSDYYSNDTSAGLNIVDSSITGNDAAATATAAATGGSAYAFSEGGGLRARSYDDYSNTTGGGFSVDRSTLSGNTAASTATAHGTRSASAEARGGGLSLEGRDYDTNEKGNDSAVVNSTVSGNAAAAAATADTGTTGGYASANASGGGVFSNFYAYNYDTGTASGLHFLASTVTANTVGAQASGNSSSAGATGGGVRSANYTVALHSTIVAGNTDVSGASVADDVSGSFTSLDHNLIGAGDGSFGLTNGVNNDQVGTAAAPIDPKLAPLADNGGPTQTHALLAGSPALNAGAAKVKMKTDQRGVGYDRHVGDRADIGAFEVQNLAPTITSDGGGETAAVSTQENKTAVTTVTANDPDAGQTLSYSLSGPDAGKFTITSGGVLSFVNAPDYDVPGDADGNNVYEVTVTVSDGQGGEDSQALSVTVTNVNEVTGFDVQKAPGQTQGQTQRSFVRYLELAFESDTDLAALVAEGRIKLTRYGLDGSSSPTDVSLLGKVTVSGNKLLIDFGVNGIGGNRNTNAGDGYYKLTLDTDDDGSFETSRAFYRLFGDVTGDRKVDSADANKILAAFGKPYSAENDVNGDGVVNAIDRTYALQANNRALAAGLPIDD